MATKAELEAELALLREQNEALKSKVEDRSEDPDASAGSSDMHLPTPLQELLAKQGIDSSDLEAMANQLVDELAALHREHPMATLLGVFVLGCIVGRAFR